MNEKTERAGIPGEATKDLLWFLIKHRRNLQSIILRILRMNETRACHGAEITGRNS